MADTISKGFVENLDESKLEAVEKAIASVLNDSWYQELLDNYYANFDSLSNFQKVKKGDDGEELVSAYTNYLPDKEEQDYKEPISFKFSFTDVKPEYFKLSEKRNRPIPFVVNLKTIEQEVIKRVITWNGYDNITVYKNYWTSGDEPRFNADLKKFDNFEFEINFGFNPRFLAETFIKNLRVHGRNLKNFNMKSYKELVYILSSSLTHNLFKRIEFKVKMKDSLEMISLDFFNDMKSSLVMDKTQYCIDFLHMMEDIMNSCFLSKGLEMSMWSDIFYREDDLKLAFNIETRLALELMNLKEITSLLE